MDLKAFSESFRRFSDGFGQKAVNEIQRHSGDFVEYIREQLYSGRDGNERLLSPTYLNDPWFMTKEAGRWYGKPRWYMGWKAHITPPVASYIGLPARPREVPNLIIRGDFYDSITAIPIQGGIRIFSQGVSFGKDIERKYGGDIFKPGPHAVMEFVDAYLAREMESYAKSLGL